MNNTIEVSIVIHAPVARVFAAVSQPSEFGQWFAKGVEGTFEVGQQPVIDEGEYGMFRLAIVASEANRYFAYRWVSGTAFVPNGFVGDPLEHPNTLVEFFFEEVPEGTKVRVVESGFASLPEAYAKTNYRDNVGGWGYQMAQLKLFVEPK